MVAAAVAGGAIVGGVASSAIGGSAAKSAANTQAGAARDAAQLQEQQFEQTRSDLQPYRDLGTSYIPQLRDALANPLLNATFTAPTAAEAAQTPGYQFTLGQGLKAAQNSASARGLGSSGAAIKGAESFATGLADSTYGDTFNRALTTFGVNQNTASNNVNRLLGIVGTGQNAAALTGSLGAQATNGIANSLTSGAAASAAGTVGAANAATGGISTGINGATNALLLQGLTNRPAANSTLYGNSYSGFDNPANYG
ncbi:hypothetical protein [Paraburkholderia caribensis]|uniref:hypothetical protein n=1 Tax=Paraburkholderia caribensis TaxID=75105 RepID=UPI0034D22CF1